MKPRAKKKLGQHFLETVWAEKVVTALNPQPTDRFVEIGPGPGALTLRLAPRVAHVTAIEVDADMIAALRPRIPGNVSVVHADFLDVDLQSLAIPPPFRVAGNLPYNVSSPILFALLRANRIATRAAGIHGLPDGMTDATLMVQREVADRILAEPGSKDYGVVSILVRLHADVRRILSLPPGAFRPAPKVHSAVVSLRFRPPAVPLTDEQAFEALVRTIFTQRRKTLLNAIRPFATARNRDGGRALADAGIDPSRRPETLHLAELARLADRFA
jgi:16S rRNA (adenine1518-N6/adenine1519-N6)-dimethyltransferase